MLASGGLFDTLFDGAIPAVGVLVATALVTVWKGRRDKVKKTADDLAELKESEIPDWGKQLQQDVGRMTRSLYGDPPWGAKGFFIDFGTFKDEVLHRLDELNGGHK